MRQDDQFQLPRFAASSQLLETLVRDANDAITLQELDGRIVAWNRGAERMYGYSEPEALAMNIAAIAVDGDTGALDYLRVIGEGGEVRAREVRRRTKDGRTLDVLLATTRVVVDDTVLVATTERDVTDQRQLATELRFELDAMTKLHEINALYLDDHSEASILDKVLDVAIEISEAAFGNIQIVDPVSGDLVIARHRGFSAAWVDYWNRLSKGQGACGRALERRERVIVDDVSRSPLVIDRGALEIHLAAGVRAVQSTPLFDHRGEPIGMLSTHYRTARRPPEHALRMLDLLAAQAAQVIGRLRDDAALRQSQAHAAKLEAAAKLTADRLRSAVDSMDDAFALFDIDDRLVLCNQAFRRLVHEAEPTTLLGRSFSAVLDAWIGDIEFSDEVARAQFRAERLASRSQDAPVTFDIRMRDGRSLRVSDRRTAEGGMMKTIWDLTEDERRARELRHARTAAERASDAKSEFLASMSHELRTPLNAILGFAELLVRDKRNPLNDRHRERVEHILSGGEHLLRLINDVLDLSRIEAGRISMSIKAVNLAEVLDEVRRTLSPIAARQHITLEVDELPAALPLVMVDRTRFAQILMNFGSNAIKYNRPMGRVRFAVTVASGERVWVSVSDTGLGIPLDKQDKLFQPFQRAGQEVGPIEGTGIGLVITKRLAELMGGTVGFHSVPDQGSEFWIEIPSQRVSAMEEAPSIPRTRSNSQLDGAHHLVLYIEDNTANVVFMRDLLSTFGNIELVTVPTAELGIEFARARVPEIVLMDINLPGISGLDALRALRTFPETQRIPVIALTAAASERDRQRGLDEGFFRYLTKPLSLDALIDAITAVFASA